MPKSNNTCKENGHLIGNQKGLTLIELLGAMAILGLVLAAVLYFTQYVNSGMSHIATREQAMQESQAILDDIVREVKKGRVDASAGDAAHPLALDQYQYAIVDNVKTKQTTSHYVKYTFDGSSHALAVQKNTSAGTFNHTFSNHVQAFNVSLSTSSRRIAIQLIMRLPNNQTHETNTVIYVPQLD